MKRCNECGAYIESTGYDCPRCDAKDSLDSLIECTDCGQYTLATDAIVVGRFKKKLYCPECVGERMEWLYALRQSNEGLFLQLVR